MRRRYNLVLSLAGPLLLVLATLASTPLSAEEHTFLLDPESTHLSFELGATGHDVHGLLYATGGEIRFDTDSGIASGELTLDARRTETGNDKRDKTMHNKVLESEAHPMIVFHAEKVDGEITASGHSEFDLIGTVELLGVPHDLILHTVADIEDGEVTAKVTCEVPYVSWGLHDPSKFVLRVAKIVQVSIEAHGTLDPTPVTTSAN